MDKNEQQINNKRTKEDVILFNKNKRMKNDTEKRENMIVNKPLSPTVQLDIIGKIRTKNEGPKYRWISMKWYIQFEGYGLGIKDRPSAIDNSDLFQENGDLRTDLVRDKHYYEIPINAWNYLEKWYGVKDQSHIISNDKEEQKVPGPKKKRNDVNLKFCVFIINRPSHENYTFTVSPNSTVGQFRTKLLSAVTSGTITDHFELWLLNGQNQYSINALTKSSSFKLQPQLLKQGERYAKRIDYSTISSQSTIADCLSQMTATSLSKNNHDYYLAIHFLEKKETQTKNTITSHYNSIMGLCGLQNLGNSCYMNSALQCLSNTPQLTHYFLSNKYKQHINRSSVLGLKGTLAEAYASLLRTLWKVPNPSTSSRYNSISPRDFKSTLEEFNEQFRGYLQQDSQELLSSLLDGLHEDLNKVLKKPYIESSSDSDDDISDMEIATKSWNYHKSRDDSFIVDLFQGQYKSRLVCDVCKKVSVTFDTFMYLSLPLPAEKHDEISMVYVPYSPSEKPLFMSIQLQREAEMKHLKQEIEKMNACSLNELVIAKIEDGKISKLFDDEDSIQTTDTIYAYQLPPYDDDKVVFPVYCSSTEKNHLLGYPLLLTIDKRATKEDLHSLLTYHLERYNKADVLSMKIRLFTTDHIVMAPFEFPLFESTMTWTENDTVQQGQGVVLEWSETTSLDSFDIEDDKAKKKEKRQQIITLEDCFDEYTHDERLSGEDAWYCPRCKELQCASKKIDIWKLPEIMVIHLKRFSQVRRWSNKVDTYIDFPLTGLDMTKRVLNQDKKMVYDLYAVDNHYGGMFGGHYTAFAKNIETSDWYEFDDTRVSKMSPEDVKTNAAYLLFYKRRSS